MYITNNISKKQFEEILDIASKNKIFFITQKDLIKDYHDRRLYVLIDKERMIGSFSIVYEKATMYYAIKRFSIFENADRGKGYAAIMARHCLSLGFHPLGMTPWITNPKSTKLAQASGMTLQYVFNEKYGWWLYE